MTLKDQNQLVNIHKQLASAIEKRPSHPCHNCKVLAAVLANVTATYSNILDGVIRKEIRQSFARRLLKLVVDVVKAYTKVG